MLFKVAHNSFLVLSKTMILMVPYYQSLSLDATIMVLKHCPIIGEHVARLLPNKYFKEPRRAKAEKLGAQQVMCWECLQELKAPKSFSWVPQAARLP